MWAIFWKEIQHAFIWCAGMLMLGTLVFGSLYLNHLGTAKLEITDDRYNHIGNIWDEGLCQDEIKEALKDNEITNQEYWTINDKYNSLTKPKAILDDKVAHD